MRSFGDLLIDLLSGKSLLLKKIKEEKWQDISDVHITNSEFSILEKAYKKNKQLISHIAKQVEFSRQATHKFIKQLEEKQLVITKKANLRDKYIELTGLGEACYEKHVALKKELENMIAEQIGEEKLKRLKEILKMDWGI
ncbi:MarR family winged helix-turn-helix transcriptional regulator [Ureibacillus sp. FSL K6-8385]|uniref:Winged helix-turn-helix transcriptional regulator n=1 Tax=Ureibacillus terrenus TaxID=118246 RepID=A0A540V1H0_9BACL|nr:MarR family winged helix-turn-helix transcriptional regulator [Ureibacillus terrenus]MED3661975.1 MarR family winged helix-turn-helix transcriptional regulator [Ureibacillus terrenus]MED3764761.1 MarR family winged helix-turn-helix transcriptional regulator [Ureibacillus terrenus]TQE90604.1 winged helix-turn-helix transcriptional regulator [Ureibacillus terrenus]